jgi:hypothetical protein
MSAAQPFQRPSCCRRDRIKFDSIELTEKEKSVNPKIWARHFTFAQGLQNNLGH